ncbi:MAG: hypothetical protein A3B68_05570 [Candidatus Melainabacteria bacterium RIFCSPHIGHO2_02_FULL_34_12]|nr:MAG: hypothetical protein A3B68_05570 [Candidatus Melainabacteria bacterium RIFCSPHIGHO2_02_FULL_34_12]
MAINQLETATHKSAPMPRASASDKARRASSASLLSTSKKTASVAAQPLPTGFWADIKKSFWTIVSALGIIFNISKYDDTPYINYQRELTEAAQKAGNGERITNLNEKAFEAVNYGRSQIARGLDPWASMPENVGVPMSSKQAYLSGGTEKQRYFYNLAVFNRTNVLLDGNRLLMFRDVDDTQKGKGWDPEDTARLQSEEATFWLELHSQNSTRLNGTLNHVTARGYLPSRNIVIPSGDNPDIITWAILNGCIEEVGGGRSLLLQELAHENMSFSSFNGSVVHHQGEFLHVSDRAVKLLLFKEYMSGKSAPRIPEVNGKTFDEAFADLVAKCAVFEQKGIPRVTLETLKSTRKYSEDGFCQSRGGVYQPHYLRICRYKQEEIDDVLEKNPNADQEQLWINFAAKVKDDVDAGKSDWENVALKQRRIGGLKEELRNKTSQWRTEINENAEVNELRLQLKEYQSKALSHIRLPGAENGKDLAECVDYYDLINPESDNYNPETFYKLCKSGEIITTVIHNYDNNDTPQETVFDDIDKLYLEYNKIENARRYVAYLNSISDEDRKLAPGVVDFVHRGLSMFLNNGPIAYLNWRLLQYFMHHYTRDELKDIRLGSGELVFDISNPNELHFSEEFRKKANIENDLPQNISINSFRKYFEFVNNEFKQIHAAPMLGIDGIIRSFLPPKEKMPLENFGIKRDDKTFEGICTLAEEHNALTAEGETFSAGIKKRNELAMQTCFYPNEWVVENGAYKYNPKVHKCDHALECVFSKGDVKNKHGQFYKEYGPNVQKDNPIPDMENFLSGIDTPATSGDSKADTDMHALALLYGGYVDVVFNKINKWTIYDKCIAARVQLANDFINEDDLYQACREKFTVEVVKNSFTALDVVAVTDGSGQKVTKYRKIIECNRVPSYTEDERDKLFKFEKDDNGQDKLYTRDELLAEMDLMYSERVIEHESTEAFARRQVEIDGLILGEDIELNDLKRKELRDDLKLQDELWSHCKKDILKAVLKPEEQLKAEQRRELYEYLPYLRLIEDEKRGYTLPDESPSSSVYREWWDHQAGFKIYRSVSHNDALVVQRYDSNGNALSLELFKGNESELKDLFRTEIVVNDKGCYEYQSSMELPQIVRARMEIKSDELSDHSDEHRLFLKFPKKDGVFANKFLLSILGEKKLKWAVANLPWLYNGFLKWSGVALGAGAVVRFLSPLMGSLAEPVYNIGYRLSNITRGIAAGAAALRGLLNVHKNKIMSMTIAEIGNIGAAAAPNGIKHMMLSGFQFFLFVSRAILAALRTQKNNAHAEKVVNNKVSVETIDDLHKYEPEIREPSRRIITLVSDILTDVKGRVNKAGLHSFFGTIIGNITATAAASLRMLKDVAHDIRLIIPSKRMSEKSGEPFIGVPSPVHLLNLAGWFSGLFTLIAGSIGLSKRFGNISEGTTFNRLGRWGVSLASLSAVPGIISNAIDVYNNQQGYPKEFSSMLGKTFNYNPQRAGLLQALGGAVIGMFSFGNLENPLTAAGFDLGNAFYYAGAGEEEVANSQVLALSQSRRGQVVYKQPLHLKLFDFVKQTITGDKKAA